MTKKRKITLIFIIIVTILLISTFLVYKFIYIPKISKLSIFLNGEKHIKIDLFDEYEDQGSIATFQNKDISNQIVVDSLLDTTKVGKYVITYIIEHKGKKDIVKRIVEVVDNIPPELTLNGDLKEIAYLDEEYIDSGYKAIDNYDGDITDKVVIEGKVDIFTEGDYEIKYSVQDSSGNIREAKRIVTIKERPLIHHDGVAVLNYHFFYSLDSEGCFGHNCLHVDKFEEQLKYLKENNYKTLTMEEFRAWIYGEIDIPNNSVLITIDDGAFGTGLKNGNYLIPLLEKYEIHATLFLITGWWDIDNYRSKWLDIESHSHNMHTEKYCDGVIRGAKMLCLSHDEVLEDLKASMSVTNSNKAFCYPFYAYNNEVMSILQEAGFKLAFAGGSRKATHASNKYAIPRYQVLSSTSLKKFIRWIY